MSGASRADAQVLLAKRDQIRASLDELPTLAQQMSLMTLVMGEMLRHIPAENRALLIGLHAEKLRQDFGAW